MGGRPIHTTPIIQKPHQIQTRIRKSGLPLPNITTQTETQFSTIQSTKNRHGTTAGTSLNSLLIITGEIPLNIRREQLTLQYWAARGNNTLVSQTWTNLQNHKPGLNRALINRAKPSFGKRVLNYRQEHKSPTSYTST